MRHHRNAGHLGVAQKVPHALLLALADQWAQVQVHGSRTHAQGFKGVAQALQQGLVNGALHQQARTGRAGLASVLHDGVDNGRQHRVQIGIGKHNLRAFAAQLQRDRAVAFGGDLLYQRAHRRAAGEADVRNAGVARQRVAHLVAIAGDEVERASRKAHIGRQLRHMQQAEAGVFRRLDHAGVASGQRRAHAAAKNLHRVVPRHDVAGHAMRLAPGQRAEAVGAGNGLAVQLVAGAGIELEVARQRQHIGARLARGLATVALLQSGQRVAMLQHLGRQAHQQTTALDRTGLLPDGVETVARGLHGLVNVFGVAALQCVKWLAVGRVQHGQRAATGRHKGFIGNEIELHGQIVRQMPKGSI